MEGTPDSTSMTIESNQEVPQSIFVKNVPIITESDIQDVTVMSDPTLRGLNISLKPEGAIRFDNAARDLVGKQVAMIVDGKVVSAPMLQTAEFAGKIQVTGNFSDEEWTRIARELKSIQSENGAATP